MLFSGLIVDHPWYFLPLCLAAGAATAAALYYRNKKNTDASRGIVLTLALLRFFFISLAVLLLLNILLRRVINETQQPLVIFAFDNSSSIISGADSAKLRTVILPQLYDAKKQLGDKFEVRQLYFGQKVSSNLGTPDFSEKETDIDQLLRDVENNYSGQNIGALVLISDGIYNRGANPVMRAEKTGYPIYTIPLGDTAEISDVAVQRINHNQVAYAGNAFPVEALVNVRGFAGKEITVTLRQDGREKAVKTLRVNSDRFLGTCNFSLTAETPGFVRYTISATPLAGEKNTLNNTQSFIIEVIDNREKLLVLSTAPHPDVAAIHNAFVAGGLYEPEFGNADNFKKPLKAYSLVILCSPGTAQNSIIRECSTERIPLWIINPQSYEELPGIKIGNVLNRYNDAEAFMADNFGLFNLSEGFRKLVRDLPAVKAPFGNYALSNGAAPLLFQRIGTVETSNPILYFNELNGHKTAVFAGDGLWRWSMRDYQEHGNHELFDELIRKTVQYLAVKSDKSFFRINAPRLVNENEAVELSAEVYNKSYELITEPDVTLTLTNAEGKKFNYTFGRNAGMYHLNLGMQAPGEYRYEARVKLGNEIVVKHGLIVVREVVSERINTVANHQLLWQLSARSNGKLYPASQIGQLTTDLLNSEQIKPITYSQVATSPLIEIKALFWLIVILASVEWFFRKRYFSI